MQPELFLLAPRHAGTRQGERRRTLLSRRADLLELVGAEEELPEELQLRNIRRMPLPDHHISDQAVWALPASSALHATVEDIHEASPQACWLEVRDRSNVSVLVRHSKPACYCQGVASAARLPDWCLACTPFLHGGVGCTLLGA